MYIIKRNAKARTHPRTRRNKKEIIANGVNLDGIYRMYSVKGDKIEQVGEEHNQVMDYCHYKVARAFLGDWLGYYMSIEWLALGDDNTPIAGTELILVNEIFRTKYVTRSSPAKVASGTFYITDTEFSGDIEEMGIFGGNAASSTADTGGLVSRVLWSYTKSTSEEIVVEYDLTIS